MSSFLFKSIVAFLSFSRFHIWLWFFGVWKGGFFFGGGGCGGGGLERLIYFLRKLNGASIMKLG